MSRGQPLVRGRHFAGADEALAVRNSTTRSTTRRLLPRNCRSVEPFHGGWATLLARGGFTEITASTIVAQAGMVTGSRPVTAWPGLRESRVRVVDRYFADRAELIGILRKFTQRLFSGAAGRAGKRT